MRLELNRLHQGDALKLLKGMNSDSVDLVVTDPPYNISNYGNSITKKGSEITRGDFGEWDKWDDIETYFGWCLAWVSELERVCKQGASFYTFFDNHYADHLTYLIEKETGFRQKAPIVLVKNNPIPHIRKTNFRSTFERATLFVLDEDKKPKTFNFISQGVMKNVMFYNIGQKKTSHPTEKPLRIIRDFVRISSNEGDLVLDPFTGSGTTAVAALQSGRNFIGFEKKLEYCEMARSRMEPWLKQGQLKSWFGDEE